MEEIWAITSYFNPFHFQSKLNNYLLFRESLFHQKVKLLTIEVSFDGNFELNNLNNVIHLSGKSILWQKERVLNLAENYLPKSCTKICWLDCDIIFENDNWANEAKMLLDKFPIIQPFHEIIRLPKDVIKYIGNGEIWNSFSFIYSKKSQILLSGDFEKHGHTGFAWGIRREIFKNKIYDACIIGSGDHVIAHAFAGDWDSPCIYRVLGKEGKHLEHFRKWCKNIYPMINGKISYLPGRILHLWHGETENRKYVSRNKKLYEFKFNPYKDIKLGKNGLWEWNSRKKNMHEWIKNYFFQRDEDVENV